MNSQSTPLMTVDWHLQLRQMDGGLVASCQPVDDGPMDDPEIVAAMAAAAAAGCAKAVRT